MKISQKRLAFFVLVCSLGFATAQSAWPKEDAKLSSNASPVKAEPFELKNVRLLDGSFQQAMQLDQKYLLSLDPNRLLHNFRLNAGLPSSAQPLTAWEAPDSELRGHFTGEYLSACGLMHASTSDPEVKAHADAVVAGLAECQAKLGDGYLSAFPNSFFDRLETRKPVWAPYYTLHKILAGLLDVDRHMGTDGPAAKALNTSGGAAQNGGAAAPPYRGSQALEVAKKLGDWIVTRNEHISDSQMQSMLTVEQGGIAEALANLSAATGDPKYLKMSLRFDHLKSLQPAEAQKDKLTSLHVNAEIPKFIGAARQYELNGDSKLASAAWFFWQTVAHNRSYVTGGVGCNEYFVAPGVFPRALGPNAEECCPAYNMLRLTRELFTLDPKADYADYYERTLYNCVLSSQDPDTGRMCHYLSLEPGAQKEFSTPDRFNCCQATGIESHAKYGDSIYFHTPDNQTLYVNLFIASELNWKTSGLTLRQETKYPDEGATHFIFTCEKPVNLAIQLRHPWWCETNFTIKINGQLQPDDSAPGTYAAISRTWKTGDKLDVTMPMTLRTEGFKADPNRLAFFYGPLVLCARVDASAKNPPHAVIAPARELVTEGFTPVKGKPNTFAPPPGLFSQPGVTNTPGVSFFLEPFYQIHGDTHYNVYWDVTTPSVP